MTTDVLERPTIEIPRLEGESARAHAARVEYIVAGPERSTAKIGQKLGKTKDLMDRWSSQWGWSEHARRYDDMVIQWRTQEAAEQYRKELEDHRKRYGDAGKALYQVAAKLLKQLDAKAATLEPGPQTLAIASRAMTIAADLEAHALRLGDILPKLDTGDE